MKSAFMILMGLLISFAVFSQEKLNKLSINPVSLFLADMNNFEYERGFAEGKFGVAFYYGRTGVTSKVLSGYRIYGSEQSVAFYRYIMNIGKPAFWFGPRISISSANIYDDDNPMNYATNIGTLGISMMMGFQVVAGGFYFTPFIGAGGAITNDLWGDARYYGDFKESRFLLSYGLKMGIAF